MEIWLGCVGTGVEVGKWLAVDFHVDAPVYFFDHNPCPKGTESKDGEDRT